MVRDMMYSFIALPIRYMSLDSAMTCKWCSANQAMDNASCDPDLYTQKQYQDIWACKCRTINMKTKREYITSSIAVFNS